MTPILRETRAAARKHVSRDGSKPYREPAGIVAVALARTKVKRVAPFPTTAATLMARLSFFFDHAIKKLVPRRFEQSSNT